MPTEFDWLTLIDKRAALREQFPPLSRLRSERPGSASDNRRKELIAADNQLSKARAEQARWQEAADRNARRQERIENEKRRREYKGYQAAKHQLKESA
ncbi:hypothetical protein [Microbacterium sp. PF5]|uniref:hypothetical protein n=1 Tax=Microbacterium sp. PF5 TaxID=2305435 RepID=UPI00109BCF64|nr:hypothetical protein [Microbacterium sp. PF5]